MNTKLLPLLIALSLAAWTHTSPASSQSQTDSPTAAPNVSGPRQQPVIGKGIYRWFGLKVYDAQLSSPAPKGAAWQDSLLLLELTYARNLEGKAIAKASREEMIKQGRFSDAQLEGWEQLMQKAFPDVKAGDRLSGRFLPNKGISFALNGRKTMDIDDASFADGFMAIWLGSKTSAPALREQLLGSHLSDKAAKP